MTNNTATTSETLMNKAFGDMPDWQRTMLQLTIIYRVLECNDKLPLNVLKTDLEFVSSVLDAMHTVDLLKISDDDNQYVATQKAHDLRAKLVEVYDHALKFEIFADVNIALSPPDEILDDNGIVIEGKHDPRFEAPMTNSERENLGTEDLRISMMIYLGECAEEESDDEDVESFDPEMIVFMQWLCNGKLKGDNIWFDLKAGTFFNEVQEIVDSMRKWEELGEDEDESDTIMGTIYTAGMLEQQKRDKHDKEVDEARAEIHRQQMEGDDDDEYEVETTTITVEEEDVWGCDYGYYGYEPYGYYNPYDPLLDAAVFCVAMGCMYDYCY